MKNQIAILIFISLMMSCSNNNDIEESFKINGRFTHLINDCENVVNPEINCIEFIEFINGTTADVLIGGGDIVIRTSYEINGNKIILEQTAGLNLDLTFNIINEISLSRVEDNEVWNKE